MRILLLGYGASNKAVYNYFKDKNHQIEILSTYDKEKIKKLKKEMPLFDICFRSPGIKYSDAVYLLSKALSKRVTNEISYALSLINKQKIIAVTGSDGKTSLVKLIEHMLSFFTTSIACGNIGVTLLDKINEYQNKEFFIVELSSFQLENLSSNVDLGIIKNIHPNHLDAYENKEIYYANKIRLINFSNKIILGDSLAFHKDNSLNLNYNFTIKNKCIYENDVKLIDIKKLKYQDTSFIENVIICLKILKYYNFKYISLEEEINKFQRIKYRLEDLGTYKNTRFINDGKSSTSIASRYAFNNFKGKRILILGGIHKSSKFKLKINKDDEVLIYGINALKIRNELNYGKCFKTLKDVLNSIKFDKKQTIIYSPGCSSFDQYENYIQRSKEFEMWVKQWIK